MIKKYILFNKHRYVIESAKAGSAKHIEQVKQCLEEIRFWVPGVTRINDKWSDKDIFNLGLGSIQDLIDVIVAYGEVLHEAQVKNVWQVSVDES